MAATLTRWDPSAEIPGLRGAMDRLFDQSFGRFPVTRNGGEAPGVNALGLDVHETDDAYVVKAAVPGVDPKDIEITVEDEVLTIRGAFEQKDEVNEDKYIRRELRYGTFQRSLHLPPTVDAANATATFENGLLRLSLPKKAEAKPRMIKITPQDVIQGNGASGSN